MNFGCDWTQTHDPLSHLRNENMGVVVLPTELSDIAVITTYKEGP